MGEPEDAMYYNCFELDDIRVYISNDIDLSQGEVKFMMDGLAWFRLEI